MTVAPVVSGETAGLRYKYSVVDLETGAWSLLAAPSADASLTWEPPAAGSYAVTVDVIDGGSYVSGSATVEVGEDWSLDSFSADPSPAFVGRPVELEASVSGTTSGLTYKFVWERGGWADWGVASERSADPSATGDLDPRRPRLLHALLRRRGLPRQRERVHCPAGGWWHCHYGITADHY